MPLLVVAGACFTGPSVRTFAPARSPGGIAADLQLDRKTHIQGEVLEVQDTALLVLQRNARVIIVPIGRIRYGYFVKRGVLIQSGWISAKDRERLRIVSRFPAGLTAELRARLLSAYGQTEPDQVTSAAHATPLVEFAARARAGTERYRDPEAARAAGYRPVGPDFPGMGRHWIHPSLILRDTLDASQPPVLEYAEIGGRPTLVGVAYAVLVKDGTPPASLPVPVDAWHFHQGTVEEESFLRSHAGVAGGGHAMAGPRIAVLHAWVWLDNPDGLLATDNWALPYARLGYSAPPAGASRDAARALALAADDGGRAYLEALLHAVGQPNAEETGALAVIVARHQAAARDVVPPVPPVPSPNVAALEHCWSVLWDDVKLAVRPEVWERLAAVR